jgi:hypothetical protein
MAKYGFVYIWYDKKHKRFYIGSHWGTETDGYICSSRWMRKAYKRRPQDFKRRIVCLCSTKQLLLKKEQRWLNMIEIEQYGKKYYNIDKIVKNPWWQHNDKVKTIGQKISESHKKNPNWGQWSKGKSVSEQTKEKLRQANLGKKHSEETKEKCKSLRHSEETKKKISEAGKGRTHTEETKKALSDFHKGKQYHILSDEAKKIIGQKTTERLTGVSKSDETKKKISETISGSKWITNGTISYQHKGILPEGFKYGRK